MEQFERDELPESPIDIKEYFYIFKSWAWLILLAGLLAGAAAYLISFYSKPVYEASTTLLVSAPSTIAGIDPSSLVTTQTMTSTYAEMLLDIPVLQGVINQLELQIAPQDYKEFKDFKKAISVDVVTNTQLLVVTVENNDPKLAADIANGMATVFTDRIRQLQSQRFATSREGLAKQASDMEGLITDTINKIAYTTDQATLQQLEARLTQYRIIYSNLVASYEQVRLVEAQTSTNVLVSESAIIPTIPVRPKTIPNILVSAVTAMLLMAVIVVGRYSLDDTIRNPEEIRNKFNLPILGVINSYKASEDRPIALAEPHSPVAEAFRSLRTNLTSASMASDDTPLRRILVTSPTLQDGKTTVASNLAVMLAQGEKKTLLLDADLRHPSIQMQFGLPNHIGLSELLMRPMEDFSNATQIVDGLTVITSGSLPPNPSELLTSNMMGQILNRLSQDFELILIDSPPMLTVTDATALSPIMDGVILVVKPGSTKLTAFQLAFEQLSAVGARVVGVVLNNVNPTSRKYGYFYHHYYLMRSKSYERKGTKQKTGKGKSKPIPKKVT